MKCLSFLLLLTLSPLAQAGPLFRSCGVPSICYSQPTYYYQQAYVAPTYSPPAVTVNVAPALPAITSPDFDTEALAYAKYQDTLAYRERILGKLTYRAPALSGYGYNGYGQAIVAQGNTQYGYSYKDVASFYGNTDLNALFQQSARLTQGAQALAGQANTDFSARIGEVGAAQSRVAEILAEGQARSRIQQSSTLAPKTTVITTGQGVGTVAPPVQPRVNPMPPADPQEGEDLSAADKAALLQSFQANAVPACVQCHGGAKPQGGFSVANYPDMAPQAQGEVIARLYSGSANKPQMPLDVQGHTAPLAEGVRRLFVALKRN